MKQNQLIINLSAIEHNYNILQQWAGSDVALMAVVKSDAYGHGMIPVSQSLKKAGCSRFAVFSASEGLRLREHNAHDSILVLMGIYPDNAHESILKNLISVVYRKDMAEWLSQIACQLGKKVHIQVKIDTGMNRLGIYPEDLYEFMTFINQLQGLTIDGFISHFAVADQPDNAYTRQQMNAFKQAISPYSNDRNTNHIANSGGIVDHKGMDYPIARAGIAIYGSSPDPGWLKASLLKPAMTFKSQIVYLKTVPPDQTISYGRTFCTCKPTRVATIPVGYANGYNRNFSNQSYVLVNGKRSPVIGRVCMNLMMIDVTDISDVSVDDPVILLGQQDDNVITADELAAYINTISYEVMCCLGSCNNRIYV
jgi:alanine racemase